MSESDVKKFLESLRLLLKEGPPDRFRASLRDAIGRVLEGKMNVQELPGYLKPILTRMAVSYEGKPLKAVHTLMRM